MTTRFKIQKHTNYDNGINLGHAVVFMKTNEHATFIDCLYKVENDEWTFYYENNACLSDEEKTEFENWFITCG